MSRTQSVSWIGKIGYALGVLLLGLMLLTSISCTFGSVVGNEFNPYTFASRQFRYTEVPAVQFQIWPVRRTSTTGQLQQWIVRHTRIVAGESRWDLVDGTRFGSTSDGRAASLYAYLRDRGGENGWLVWSKKHPERSRVLWCRVVWLAQNELYFLIPDALESAKEPGSSVQAFEDRMENFVKQHVTEAIEKFEEAGQSERAASLKKQVEETAWQELYRSRGDTNGLSEEDALAEDPDGKLLEIGEKAEADPTDAAPSKKSPEAEDED